MSGAKVAGGSRTLTAATAAAVAAAIAAAAVCFAASAAESVETPAEWLDTMDAAFRDLDYDGVFSYYTANRAQQAVVANARRVDAGERALGFGGFGVGYRTAARLATFRVVHKVVDGVERERVVHLDGPPREILRTGQDVTCVLEPGDSLLSLESVASTPYARVFARRFENMSDNYAVAVNGRGRVAARPAVLLSVAPKDHDRFGYRLWLDEATGLLLRSELHDADGANLEILQFTSLRVGDDVAEADLEPALAGGVVRHLSRPAQADAGERPRSDWFVRWVPRGFRMTGAHARRRAEQGVGTLSTLVFSDGLAAFSVFIEAMPQGGAGSVVSRRGATVVLTHPAAGGAGEHLVTVVGEVPVATARRIAAGVAQGR